MLATRLLWVAVWSSLTSAASLNFDNVPSTVNWGDKVTVSWSGGNSSKVRLWIWNELRDANGYTNALEVAPGKLRSPALSAPALSLARMLRITRSFNSGQRLPC